MKKLFLLIIVSGFLVCNVPAAVISTIDQLDEAAEFSFSILSDNQGNSESGPISKAIPWIRSHDKFCIGNGDLFNGNNDTFQNVLSDVNDWFHYNFYPVIGDHDNEIRIDGVRGHEKDWGRSYIVFDMVAGIYNRPNVEFRVPENRKVLSRGEQYDDQYLDFYAKETHGKFTVHIIAVHIGDKSVFAKRSANFMYNKVKELSKSKTDHDIIVLVAHDERWFSRAWQEWGVWKADQIDFMLGNTDMIVCSSDHRFRRVHELDGRVPNQALIVDSGQCNATRGGYLEVHVFDNPPRLTAQYTECADETSRVLQVGAYKKRHILPERKETDEQFHPMMKEINGPITQPIDWNNFDLAPCANGAPALKDPASYVDPRIGNISQLLVPTFPTYQQPNQMIRMYPARKDYASDQYQSFPLQVMDHRGRSILQMRVSRGDVNYDSWSRKMAYDHDLEVVHPWLYETYLIEDDITIGFTPGKKAAIYRFDFPAGKQNNILISGSKNMVGKVIGPNAFNVTERVTYRSKNPEAKTVNMSIWCYGELTDANGKPATDLVVKVAKKKLSIECGPNAPSSVQLKYAISYINQEQAKKNYTAELKKQNFSGLAASAKAAWDVELNKISVKGGTEAQKRTFYTAMYRTHERMVNVTEDGKYYSGYDQKVHKSNRPFYVDDWIWDTYRAQHPLRTIIAPQQEEDMLQSYVEMYKQSGWMPTFPQVGGNMACMSCYHSSAIFLDAYRKGLKNFDIKNAYAGVRKNLTEGTWIPWRQGAKARGLDEQMNDLGYMPALHPDQGETERYVDGYEKRQAVSISLGRSYDTWVLSQWAKDLGKTDDHEAFAEISDQYKLLWHPKMEMFMPKDSKGQWIFINPKSAGGKGYRDYYDENNGWTFAWGVPHDIEGLIELNGGKEQTIKNLDQLFREPLDMPRTVFHVDGGNSTGMVGQFSMGNEPSFHIPYLYNYCGAAWRTQQRTRFLLDVWFKDNVFGIPGDEDGGGMSAWVVFTAMGFYPVTVGEPVYAITSPIFTEVAFDVPGGQFKVVAPASSKVNKYIQKAELNGKPLNTPFITHEQIIAGGELTLELGPKPNKKWGTQGGYSFK
jgi:predicted alpha-1,2-mannosidase